MILTLNAALIYLKEFFYKISVPIIFTTGGRSPIPRFYF